MSGIDDVFNAILFGSGSWLGLILLSILLLSLASLHKYAGMLSMPIGVFVSIEYATRNLGWHAIIIFLAGMFSLYLSIGRSKKRNDN